jgi:hypothetical protein
VVLEAGAIVRSGIFTIDRALTITGYMFEEKHLTKVLRGT